MIPIQQPLFPTQNSRTFRVPFPTTRYQGSKRKFVNWIWDSVSHLDFDSVLDVFGGTGVVSHAFKTASKAVTYNDALKFNWCIGLALIENKQDRLSEEDIDLVLSTNSNTAYPDFIQRTFHNIYFTDEENQWLDRAIYNINHLIDNPHKQAIAQFALFQACIAKRPYNLFHRANLYMRKAEVKRSFGNKTTWDTPFETHFRVAVNEANRAVFDNGRINRATNVDALHTTSGFDLVYIDPPYMNRRGTSIDYRDFYHFLEGMVNYDLWSTLVDYQSKHRRLFTQPSDWNNPKRILDAFEQLIQVHKQSILVISYRDDGIPSRNQLISLLKKYKNQIQEASQPTKYVLAHKKTHELLLIAT